MKTHIYFPSLLILIISNIGIHAQPNKSYTNAVRITDAPHIDGQLDEEIWKILPILNDFIQWSPYNGRPPSQKTEGWVGYDDKAIYIGAICYDNAPDSLMKEVGTRDNHGWNTEVFAVHISPYNDGIHSLFFDVSLAGVQRDIKFTGDDMETEWDAVWESRVSYTDNGWIVEMKIPFSALRFSSSEIQDWGFNLWRYIAREREWSNWSYVSNEIDGWWKQMGVLKGFRDLDPPLRLSFTPYVSGYCEKGLTKSWRTFYNGGMDLKYGITESFTLDMTLIPDFGQVQSDDLQLNLSPYEIKYNEKRQFFTEGTELFNKANLFYSRRIGTRPADYYEITNGISGSEKVLKNPEETRLINATKFSGRTNRGLGIGILNAMTSDTHATVADTLTGRKREILTQSFTNYNLLVLDQTLFANSYISVINSSVLRKSFSANVTAAEFRFADKGYNYSIKGVGAFSQIIDDGSNTTGYKVMLEGGKIGGRFQSVYHLSVISDTYNQNDLGYLKRNNEVSNNLSFEHNIFNPFLYFLNMSNRIELKYERMFKPDVYSNFSIQYSFSTSFKNQYYLQINATLGPLERHDYYEPRVQGRYFIDHKYYHNNCTIETDPRKSLSVGAQAGFTNSYDYDFDTKIRYISIEPTLKLNNQFRLGFAFYYGRDYNQLGYVDDGPHSGTIVFGKRDRKTVTNTLNGSYDFNHLASINFRLRHYWSKAVYDSYFELQDDGHLNPMDYHGTRDANYNAFNIDMTFRWIFSPGSEILVNWKNSIYADDKYMGVRYWDNLKNTLDAPQINSFSIKILYYLDYLSLKRSN